MTRSYDVRRSSELNFILALKYEFVGERGKDRGKDIKKIER